MVFVFMATTTVKSSTMHLPRDKFSSCYPYHIRTIVVTFVPRTTIAATLWHPIATRRSKNASNWASHFRVDHTNHIHHHLCEYNNLNFHFSLLSHIRWKKNNTISHLVTFYRAFVVGRRLMHHIHSLKRSLAGFRSSD